MVPTVCYFPDGTPIGDVPCNQTIVDSGGHSPCCGLSAWCLDNGLCFGDGVVSRGSCTDSEWGQDCAQYCNGPNDNPGGGIPLTTCDPGIPNFACGSNIGDLCGDDSVTKFSMIGGTNIILRDYQAAPLEGDGTSVAMTIGPSDTISPFSASRSGSGIAAATTVTVTASSTSSQQETSGQVYSVGEIAGAAAGTGAPLLLMLIPASMVIVSLRRRLREARKEVEVASRERPGMHQQHFYSQSSAPAYYSPPTQPTVSRDGYFGSEQRSPREMGDQGIRELSTSGQLSEMDNEHKPRA